MRKYNKIYNLLSICTQASNQSAEYYKNRFEEVMLHYDSNFIKEVKSEIRKALRDKNWSWKEAAEEQYFYAYYPEITEVDLLNEIRWLMWDYLFVFNSPNNKNYDEEE